MNNLDFSLFKVFALTEHKSFQFRSEFFNALNHTQFALPAAATFQWSFLRLVLMRPDAGEK